MSKQALLIELGGEELPPKALQNLARAFADSVTTSLEQAGLVANAERQVFYAPRRMAVYIPAVAERQIEQHIERRGPAVSTGLDEKGLPTKALEGFARSCGVATDALEKMHTDKGEWFVYRATKQGKELAALLPDMIIQAAKSLPIPRMMRWGDYDYSFVRPLHWLVILHGSCVLDMQWMGLESGRCSYGHRFHHPQEVEIADADSWQSNLEKAHVLVDPAVRRQRIIAEVNKVASKGTPRLSDDLLNELVSLNAWPVAIACQFDREFLQVPSEALITTMESNQKFVPVFADDGTLTEEFIGIANIDSREPDEIRKGYERVIRPRFADAKFFYEEDLKTPLEALQKNLEQVTYQKALGSLWDKTCRTGELSRIIAGRVDADPQLAMRAAALCKCDLLTLMVGEFPELQGIMGRYYAAHAGEDERVADALDGYYMPRHSGDAIARGRIAQVLAIADRMDTLCGIFAVGMKPTGNKDPYALRRAALSLVRTLIEGQLALDIDATLREALELISDEALEVGHRRQPENKDVAFNAYKTRTRLRHELEAFIHERLRSYYADQGVSHGVFSAVAAVAPRTLVDFDKRLHAVSAFSQLDEAESLAAANKRVSNLLRKQAAETTDALPEVAPDLLEEPAEKDLASQLELISQKSEAAIDHGDYASALNHLAALKAPIDRFFADVMVMSDDVALKHNRLALLASLRDHFMAIADIGKL